MVRVLRYRFGVKTGVNPVRRLQAASPTGTFFSAGFSIASGLEPSTNWHKSGRLFSYRPFSVSQEAPDWHANPLTGKRTERTDCEWWQIPDFDPTVGDIKTIWELSRFDWVLAFAQQSRVGMSGALDRLNDWLDDWCRENPPFKGANWKCGQEASIRLMHMAMAALILEQTRAASEPLADLVELHLERIAPTIRYAIAQDNNHGTSEAAALFIGGSWLAALGRPKASRWAISGRKWLENRAARLIGEDGSFSQYSLNYHRVMLDTFSMVEVWRRHLGLQPFSVRLNERVRAAVLWLYTMVNPWNGDGPNLGANDGARLLPLTDTDYRDFRPSVQLASALYCGSRAYSSTGSWDQPLHWLGIDPPDTSLRRAASKVFDDGGFAVLLGEEAKVLLRYPRFRFRPSQSDALHVDFWLKDRNLLRDAGTYSYNTAPRWLNYFPGTAGHNTVQFDGRDQMPRLSRFLFGAWLKTTTFRPLSVSAVGQAIAAGYRDWQGAIHRRQISLAAGLLSVVDEIEGFKNNAVLRWRLEPGDWRIEQEVLTNGEHSIRISASMPIRRQELVQGWESRYYQDKQPLPVLEVEVNEPGTLMTEFRWTP